MVQVTKPQPTGIGYCPKCGARGVKRERRMNGDDICEKGCKYPSRDALPLPTGYNEDGE